MVKYGLPYQHMRHPMVKYELLISFILMGMKMVQHYLRLAISPHQ